ncbi:MAG: GAF domain-containing protein, partial [Firmicutes bacterium]|nr:GAF domain-containing protein [Bacillota bacterium]
MEQNDCAFCCEPCQRNRTIRDLIKLGMDLAGCDDEQVILNKALKAVLSAFEGRWCVLRILDEKTGELTIKASAGIPEKIMSMATTVKPEGTLLGKVLSSGVTLRIENINEDNSKIMPYCADEIKSVLVAPLKTSRKIIGTLKIYSSEPQQWSKHDYLFLT